MTDWLIAFAIAGVLILAEEVLARVRVTRCTCGRTVRWWFTPNHERHALMVTRAVLCTGILIHSGILAHDVGFAVFSAVFTVLSWWRVKVHGSGKRRWPKRLAGAVRVNQHGRLVVTSR